jgi:hypothetical protein
VKRKNKRNSASEGIFYLWGQDFGMPAGMQGKTTSGKKLHLFNIS